MSAQLSWDWLGLVSYGTALEQQRERRDQVIAGHESEIVWMLEHEPVVTTGRRVVADMCSREALEAEGIELFKTERGGLATYHGPGQLTAYAIVDCWKRGMGAKGAVHAMEQGVIDWLATLGVPATRRSGFPGVWIDENKVCAVGMHFKRGISMHGIAINLTNDLKGFSMITPCGITDGGVTTLKKHTKVEVSPEEAAKTLGPILIRNLLNPTCMMTSRSRQAG